MKYVHAVAPVFLLMALGPLEAADPPAAMFGGTPSRNMVSTEKSAPVSWDVTTGENIKWKAKLGSQTYAGPVVYGGQVYVGTNNEGQLREGIVGDKGVVMAFDAETGEFLWQATHDKLPAGRINDWPLQGICSTPHVEGDRVYYVSNRAEVVAVDTQGFSNGNQGIQNEIYTGPQDADIIWSFDLIGELDAFPHNLAAGSPLVVGDLVYVTTGHGVDEGHVNIPSPLGPSFVAIHKDTGEIVWESSLPGENVLHGTWGNAAFGVAGGRAQIVFPGGDGILYSFDPESKPAADADPDDINYGKVIWQFDLNPEGSVWELGGSGTKNNIISTPVFLDGIVYIGVGQDPEHGEGPGHFWAIDASMEGDVTGKAGLWHFGDDDFNRTISTAAISNGRLYIPDLSGFLYALDLKTGKHLWTHDTFAAVWGSAMVVAGRIYLGDEDGDVVILEEGSGERVITELNMGSALYTTPTVVDGVMYIATRSELFAISE